MVSKGNPTVQVRLDPARREWVDAKAEAQGITPAEVLRNLVDAAMATLEKPRLVSRSPAKSTFKLPKKPKPADHAPTCKCSICVPTKEKK